MVWFQFHNTMPTNSLSLILHVHTWYTNDTYQTIKFPAKAWIARRHWLKIVQTTFPNLCKPWMMKPPTGTVHCVVYLSILTDSQSDTASTRACVYLCVAINSSHVAQGVRRLSWLFSKCPVLFTFSPEKFARLLAAFLSRSEMTIFATTWRTKFPDLLPRGHSSTGIWVI